MFAIETDSLYKSFDGTPVLRDLNLRIPEGQVYGLLGPGGAGKSILLHLLLGFLKKDRGMLRVLGTGDIERVRSQIGYLPQAQHYHTRYTAREYLRYLGGYHGLNSQVLDQRINEELEAVGLSEVADRQIEGFTRSAVQRLGLAQALLGRPALLLLDEPTAGLDANGQREIVDLIASLRRRGQTILLATQYLDEAEYLCERIGMLNHGQLITEANAQALRAPGRNALITVSSLPAELAEQLQQLSPAIQCDTHEIALQPNSPALQQQVLYLLIQAGVTIIALEPFGRPLEDLYLKVVRGIALDSDTEPTPATPTLLNGGRVVPGRPGMGDTLLRELLKTEDTHKDSSV